MKIKEYSAVIIEDMPIARQALKQDLQDHCPEVTILGMAEGVVSGAKLIRKYQPEIIFLDVELTDGTGFDLLEIISDHKGKVIFTTGSKEYAIKAFRFAAVDYLIKPIKIDELKESVQKLITQGSQQKEQLEILRDGFQQNKRLSKIVLSTNEKIVIAKLSEILYCNADSNYTTFNFLDGSGLMVTKTLKEFELLLKDSGFFRVHQSHLVNLQHIKEFIKQDGGYLIMQDGERIPVSFRKKTEVLKILSNI